MQVVFICSFVKVDVSLSVVVLNGGPEVVNCLNLDCEV